MVSTKIVSIRTFAWTARFHSAGFAFIGSTVSPFVFNVRVRVSKDGREFVNSYLQSASPSSLDCFSSLWKTNTN